MNYYENENGVDIREWLMEIDPEAWGVISMFNALKYHVRAGKKEGEPKEKDEKKKFDYLKDYAEVTEQTVEDAIHDLHDHLEDFVDYDN